MRAGQVHVVWSGRIVVVPAGRVRVVWSGRIIVWICVVVVVSVGQIGVVVYAHFASRL